MSGSVAETAAPARVWLWLLTAIAAAVIVYALRQALWPFLAGMLIAYLLDPLADRLQRLGAPRGLAAALIVLTFFAVLITVLIFVVPLLIAQAVEFVARVPAYIEQLRAVIKPIFEDLSSKLTETQLERLEAAIGQQGGRLVGWIGNILGAMLASGAILFNILSLLVIMPVVSFYLIRDWDDIVALVNGLLPRDWAASVHARMREVDERLSGFVRGQATVCLILGVWNAIGLSLVGLEFGLVIGLTAGFVSFIPYLGTIIGLGLGLGVAIAQFDSWQPIALVGAVFAVSQVLEGWILTPNLVGDRVGLHPTWLLFALMAGGALAGFTGVLLAVPVATVIGVFVRAGIDHYRGSRLYQGTGGGTDTAG